MVHKYTDRARSWSQISQYEQCSRAYFLERIAQVWSRPAAWFATGLGVHSAVEAYEKGGVNTLDDMLQVAQCAFADDVNKHLTRTPNPDSWFASGPYTGARDIARRYADLVRHLRNYIRLADVLPPIEIDVAGPMVEHPVRAQFGTVEVHGSIDQVRASSDHPGELEIWDVKAGSVVPDDPGQLLTYAAAVREETGRPVTSGGYVMTAKHPTKTGNVSKTQIVRKDLTTISLDQITDRFGKADEGIRAENWDPKPGPACDRCGVLSSCDTGQKFLRS